MKRFWLILCVIMMCGPAMAKFKQGSSGACYVDNSGADEFWYCGNQNKDCAKEVQNSWEPAHWYGHKGSFSYDGRNYWCCTDANGNNGRWVQAENWEGNSTEVIVDLGNGNRCKYLKGKNVCGEETGKPCTEPDPEMCATGYIWRWSSKSCAPICKPGQAYESELLNNCVDCPTGPYQGKQKVSIDGKSNEPDICAKCDELTQMFSYKQGECISKESVKKYSKAQMKECWQCDEFEDFKRCAGANGKYDADIIQSCHIKQNGTGDDADADKE